MLKNRVALYSICGSKPLTYDEVWERLDNGLQVWFRIFINYALGYENSDSSKVVERIDYDD